MIQCPQCGKQNTDDTKFCGECGFPLTAPPPQKPFYKNAWFITLAAVFVLFVIAAVSDGKNNNGKDQPITNEGTASDVHFKIEEVKSAEYVDQYTKEKAAGTFKIVKITVTNNQKEAIKVSSHAHFKLYDDKNREFSTNTKAELAYSVANASTKKFFITTINPGNSYTGFIIFDVPKDAKGFVLIAQGGIASKTVKLKVE